MTEGLLSASSHPLSSFKNYALQDGNVQLCNDVAKNDSLGFELRTFVAIPTFHENKAKVITTMVMILVTNLMLMTTLTSEISLH